MSTVITLDKHYKNIASALRYAFDTDAQYSPAEMATHILNLPAVVEEKTPDIDNGVYFKSGIVIQGSTIPVGLCAYLDIETFELPDCKIIPTYAFRGSTIQYITIPETVEEIGSGAFDYCENLSEIVFPSSVVTLGVGCFSNSGLTSVTLPSNLINIGRGAFEGACLVSAKIEGNVTLDTNGEQFRSCELLEQVDFCGELENIYKYTFAYCDNLTALILRGTSCVCALDNTNVFTSTPIAKGTGYIYVPSALVDSYKAATNWSTYAAQVRAIEDYTTDGSITGDLDDSKI